VKRQLCKDDQAYNWQLLEDPPISQKGTPRTASKVKCRCLLCGDDYQVTYNNLINGLTKNCLYCRPRRQPPKSNPSCPECGKPGVKQSRRHSKQGTFQYMRCRPCKKYFMVDLVFVSFNEELTHADSSSQSTS